MYAIEFQTKVENGHIEIPTEFKGRLAGCVRVIVLAEEQHVKANLLDQLLATPIKLDHFEPLTREEIYYQCSISRIPSSPGSSNSWLSKE